MSEWREGGSSELQMSVSTNPKHFEIRQTPQNKVELRRSVHALTLRLYSQVDGWRIPPWYFCDVPPPLVLSG